MVDSSERHPCSSCAEPIKTGARICPHCGAQQADGWTGAKVLKLAGGLVTVLSVVFAIQGIHTAWNTYSTRRAVVDEKLGAARALVQQGSYEGAWELLEAAQNEDPTSPLVRALQIEVASEWLMSGYRPGRDWGGEGPWAICRRVHSQLVVAGVHAKGAELADLEALIAWSTLMRSGQDRDPSPRLGIGFASAVELWPDSFTANLLLGYWLATGGKDPIAAVEYWERAVRSGRDTALVRGMALRVLLDMGHGGPKLHHAKRLALLTTLDSMHGQAEPYPDPLHSSGYTDIYGALSTPGEEANELLARLPIERHLALNDWVQSGLAEQLEASSYGGRSLLKILYIRGRLLEESGDVDEALEMVRAAGSTLPRDEWTSEFETLYARLIGEPWPDAFSREPFLVHARHLAEDPPDSPEFEAALAALPELAERESWTWMLDLEERERLYGAIEAAIERLMAWEGGVRTTAVQRARIDETTLALRHMRARMKASYSLEELDTRELEDLVLSDAPAAARAELLFSLARAYANHGPFQVYTDYEVMVRNAYLREGLDRLEAALEAGYDDWTAIEDKLSRLRALPEYASFSLGHGRPPPRDEAES